MGKILSFRDLIVWQKAIALSKNIYLYTEKFPKTELYGLTSQMRRASVSVACNIAEGQARNTTGEFKQFLGISKGSLAELETLITIANEMGFLKDTEARDLSAACEEVSKMLNGLMKALVK
jgi:four helix bundle protein